MMATAVRQKGSPGRDLVVLLDDGERLSEGRLEWLQSSGRSSLLVPFSRVAPATEHELHYDVSGLRSLRSYLLAPRGSSRVAGMLVNLLQVVALCADAGGDYRSMLFDSRSVFVGKDGQLRFVYVPLERVRFRARNSPLAFLRDVVRYQLVLGPFGGAGVARKVRRFLRESDNVFSYNRYRAFLVDELPRELVELAGEDEGATGGSGRYDLPEPLMPRISWHVAERTRITRLGTGDVAGAEYVLRRSSDGSAWALEDGRSYVVGRCDECDVRVVGNARVSRRHAELSCADGAVRLRDLGSRNGTSVGGRLLEEGEWAPVGPGQEISLSTARFRLEVPETGRLIPRAPAAG